jgi:hypothetical protein
LARVLPHLSSFTPLSDTPFSDTPCARRAHNRLKENDMATTENTATEPRPKRRWFQFSLRTLLIVVTVFAVWCAYQANRAATQRRALAMVERLCANRRQTSYDPMAIGGIAFDYQLQKNGKWTVYDPLAPPPAPAWLRQLIGEELFRRPVNIDLSDTDVTDADLAALEGLSSLRTLRLYRTAVTEKAVGRLQRALPNCRIEWSPLDI